MKRITKHHLAKTIYVPLDILCICASIFLVCKFRQGTLHFNVTFHSVFIDPANPYRFAFLFWIVIAIFINNAYGLYQTRREIFETMEILQVIKAVILSSLITIILLYSFKMEDFPRSILILGAMGMIVSFSFWRILKRIYVEYLVSQGYNNFNALIVGAGRVGNALAQEIHKRPGLGIKVVGFLDDFKANEPAQNHLKILGKISELMDICRKQFINKVFITIHHDSQVFLRLLEEAKQLGISVQVVPQGFNVMMSDFFRYNIGFIPLIEYCDVSYRRQVGKRLFDFLVASILIGILSPGFLILALAVVLDNPGPVFYFSTRYGRGGRVFKMYKFRSMVKGADKIQRELESINEMDGPIFKIKNDPRITRFGRILRRYSLDELPQIINVIRGDMSLVGPRPLPIAQIEKEDMRQLKRLEIRPGITGLWQIRGRSDASFSRLVRWDVWYINNWSFWLDLMILFRTIPVVFKGNGAY